LAAQELQLAGARLADAPLDVAVLLGRHREEHHTAGEMVEGLGVEQAHGSAEQPGDLRIMAAGVRGARLGIGHRMAGDDERVQLAEHGEGGARAGPAGHVRPHAGRGEAALRGKPQPAKGFLDEPRGLDLLEAELGVLADLLAEFDVLLGALVDGLVDALLQFVFGHGQSSARYSTRPWTTTTWSRPRGPSASGWSPSPISCAGSTSARASAAAGDSSPPASSS